MSSFQSSNPQLKLKWIKYSHLFIFGILSFYYLFPYWQHFTFEWIGIENVVSSSWNSFFYQLNPAIILGAPLLIAIYNLLNLLLPMEASVLLCLIALKTEKTKISPYVFALVASAYVLKLLFYLFLFISEYPYMTIAPIVITLFSSLVVALPALLLGIDNQQEIESYNPGEQSMLWKVALLPLSIVKKTIEFSESKKENKIIHSLFLLLGLSVASKVATFMYQVLLICTIIPVGAFIVIWAFVIAIALYIGYKLLTINSDKETVVTKERTSFFRGKYLSHEVDGDEVARTYHNKGLIRDYDETVDKDGNIIAKSEQRSGILKGDYVEHRDADGNVIGTSQKKDTIFGKEIEHRDKDGDVIATSKKRSGLAEDYTETTKK